ncbi:Kinesin- motor protein [Coemansia sp. RSA 2050]|nr:Kinesin- motor protein [Coemansia sp. RSA 2050]KAJ2736730.1 Kinesin- motor protein [Coemansia sp. BCRC 34962]
MNKAALKPTDSDQAIDANIQVVVRCRDVAEKVSHAYPKVEMPPDLGQYVRTRNSASETKMYSFDGVFGPRATQEQIYEKMASPILEEVMQGFSCTIFAYGQTGTGKTYTMQGDLGLPNPQANNGDVLNGDPLTCLQVPTNAGLIPRSLHNLFYILNRRSVEYKVHISYVELYNEVLVDLLSSEDFVDGAGLTIIGPGQDKSVFIPNLTKIRVRKSKEAMDLLKDGIQRRKVAATRCNKESSRSHAIFTIHVEITERDETGIGQVIHKSGKLNLVDLAGSENVGQSGADARETGSINKSLLALGRVISAVAAKSPHVPYRTSKLTQMLSDSLGGNTRACMIATINTSQQSFVETVKTLKYADQAKGVCNKITANTSVVRADLIDNMQKEIDGLRDELNAARDCQGFYMTTEAYKGLTEGAAEARIQAEEWKLRVDLLESEIAKSRALAEQHTASISQLECDNVAAAEALRESLAQQTQLVEQLRVESLFTRAHAYHEHELGVTARQLCSGLAQSRSEGEQLYARAMRLADREQRNVEAATRVSSQAQADAQQVLARADALGARAANHVSALLSALQSRIGADFDRSLTVHVDAHTSKLRAELQRVAETSRDEGESKAKMIGAALDATDLLSAGLRSAVETAVTDIGATCAALVADAQAYQLQTGEQLRASAAAVRQILDTAQADSDRALREAQAKSERLIEQIRAESLEMQQRSAGDIAALQRQVEELRAEELKADEADMQAIALMLAQRRQRSAAASSAILARATANSDARNTLAQAQVDRSDEAAQAQTLAARVWHAGTCAAHNAAVQGMEADASTADTSTSDLVRSIAGHCSVMRACLDSASQAAIDSCSETATKLVGVRQKVEAMSKAGETAVQLASSAAAHAADSFAGLLSDAFSACTSARDEVTSMAQAQAVDFGSSIAALSSDITGIATAVQRGLAEGVLTLESSEPAPSPPTQPHSVSWNVTRSHDAILALYPANEHADRLDWTGEPATDGEPTDIEPMDVVGPTTPRKRPSESDILPPADSTAQRPVRRPRTRLTLDCSDPVTADENDPPPLTIPTPPSEADAKPNAKQVSGIPMPRRTRRVRN